LSNRGIYRRRFRQIAARLAGIGLTATLLLTAPLGIDPAAAQSRPLSLVRDAETENIIRSYADPLFRAAGLDPAGIRILLVNDDSINAFVAGGMRMFINTGLLIRSDSANQVIGVIAHETGHISGAHLSRIQEELRNATIEQIIGMLLGGAAAAASGEGGAVIAGSTLGNEIARRSLFAYTRTQESAADHAGMGFLDRTQQSSRGLLEFFEKLEGQEFLSNPHDPYLRTHPLTTERIASVEEHVKNSPFSDAKDSSAVDARHQRMLAKLKGYLWPLTRVEQEYPDATTVPGRYARAVALYRESRMKEAVALMDSLLAEAPDDPYYLEQKGQILYDSGRLAEALPVYTRAHELAPYEPMITLGLAQVEVGLEQPELNKLGIRHLEEITRIEPRNARAWYFLAIAHGRDGNMPMASLAQAEQAMAQGDPEKAWAYAKRALEGMPTGSPGWLRANDVISEAQIRLDRYEEPNP
jgi:predicted Zn-dependent protease